MGEPFEILMSRASVGDEGALSALLKRYGRLVRRGLVIAPQYRSVLDLYDVMQVTMLEAFLHIAQVSVPDEAAFIAWLRQIAHNNLRDAVRSFEAECRPPPGCKLEPRRADSAVLWCELMGAASAAPVSCVATAEIKKLVDAAIAGLPPDYAIVVRLFDLEGCTGPEVAAAMGRSRGAVHMLRARAHDRLREHLGSSSRFFSNGV